MSSSTASKLEGLIGLEGAKRVVGRLCSSEFGIHAVLFYGASGSGKDELARILAQSWLCQKPTPMEGADGSCQSCVAYERGNNPDCLTLEPLGLSSLIMIRHFHPRGPEKEDDPYPVSLFLRTGPIMSRYKVVVIRDAHRMTADASNALLKTLEEPGPQVKLVLTTDSIGGVRATVLSRCLAVACSLPTDEELRTRYADVEESDLLLSERAPGRLHVILENADEHRAVARFAKELAGRKRSEALVLSDQFRSIAEKIGGSRRLNARAANAESLALLATVLARESGSPKGLAQAVVEAHRRILANGNPAIVLDALFAEGLGV